MVNNFLMLEELSKEEQNAVTQLRSRMIGYMDQDMYEDVSVFVRFLRARDLNINAAETMLKHHIEWRKINQVDVIQKDYVAKEICAKYIPFTSLGIDKEGSPILYFNVGTLDPRGILKSCKKIDITKCIVQKLEANIQLMKEQSYKRGKYIDKWIMVLNFEDLAFSVATHKQTLEVVGNLIVMYESNYPERLKTAYFINASLYFTMAFSVVKHFLSEKTYRKIKVFGKDGWEEELQKAIDMDVLPACLGGSRTDPDGNRNCETIIIRGGPVPATYFINKKENTLANLPGVQKLTVTRMSKTQLTLTVNECGSHIEWEFETKSRDIGFSLLYKKNFIENQTKELIPKQRIDASTFSETGLYKCKKPGIYIIVFDNTYSWIHQKEIFYRVNVVNSSLTD